LINGFKNCHGKIKNPLFFKEKVFYFVEKRYWFVMKAKNAQNE